MIRATLYTTTTSPKLDYILRYFFEERLGISLTITVYKHIFQQSDDTIKINYSSELLSAADLSIYQSDYFSDFDLGRIPDFEAALNIDREGKIDTDIFAATFYLLARIEEYSDLDRDNHGRFKASNSILSKRALLDKPIVDVWVEEIRQYISVACGKSILPRSYSSLSTVDIDHVYAYKGKSLLVKIGGLIKNIFSFQLAKLMDRFSNKDPYDTYEEILSAHENKDIVLKFFILTSERTNYDRSLSPENPAFIEIAKHLSEKALVGIHPSYGSMHDASEISKQRKKLQSITGKTIDGSRQHFLRVTFPETYRALIESGIQEDYSMGYAEMIGYRAGTSIPFKWYDLLEDKATNLKVVPFQIMDVTLKKYLELSPASALRECKKIMEANRLVNGQTCIIWHNSSFYDKEGWNGWDIFYKELLSVASA